ncbi:MAG: T9SS type A sorting domain-containing protein [Candidatus Zixiibacteriota bacterium]|nr:MAG: T9SS type A sorting domain-containing protein [candidate division Zixibacteria bacterium]
MKRLSVFLVLALVLSFGLSQAQTSVSLESISTYFAPDTIRISSTEDVVIQIRTTNGGIDHYNPANGFEIYSPDGLTWDPLCGNSSECLATQNCFWAINPDDYFDKDFINVFGNTGSDADTVGYGGVSFDETLGLIAGWDGVFYTINLGKFGDPADAGKHICIDSAYFPPGGTWKWAALTAGDDVIPDWDGPHCWELYAVPDEPAEIDGGPTNYSFSHCDVGTIDFDATDPDGCPPEGDPPTAYEFEIVSGPGAIDASTGVWTWSGGTVPQSGLATLVVHVRSLCGGGFGPEHTVNLTVTNTGPAFTDGCGTYTTVQAGDTKCVQFAADDDCDLLTYTVTDYGGATGTVTIVDGLLCYGPSETDPDLTQPIVMTVEVSDGEYTAECTVDWNVLGAAPYQVFIEPDYSAECGALQGHLLPVDINLCGIDVTQGIGGFDFLIAYDNSALSFQMAVGGDIYDLCDWEYFDYRYGPYGNCGNACPSGMLRVIGLEETNDGVINNTCGVGDPEGLSIREPRSCISLAVLTFLVSNDRTLECQVAPIRFFWYDCGDNTISNLDGTELYISTKVYDCNNPDPIQGEADFPTYLGAQEVCLGGDKESAIRNIDFTNGCVEICCEGEIDARGDINLNGLAYEIADAVMLTNYFIDGLGAFQYPEGSIAASDVNADGIALSVADLVYLIRVVVGDALPYPKTNPVAANYSTDEGVVSVDSDMGAAFIVVEGDQIPDLMADNMEMEYAFDGANTRIVIYSMKQGETFSGEFIGVDDVISVEFATYEGTPVAAKNVPTSFALEQNYPNPFNPTAMIRFSLPNPTNWTLTFYNVTGQVVESVNGYDEGYVEYAWDASELASGIYFYKLEAGEFTATKKAALLK